MAEENNQAICDLKENVIDLFNSKFAGFEPSEESEWEEVNEGFKNLVVNTSQILVAVCILVVH